MTTRRTAPPTPCVDARKTSPIPPWAMGASNRYWSNFLGKPGGAGPNCDSTRVDYPVVQKSWHLSIVLLLVAVDARAEPVALGFGSGDAASVALLPLVAAGLGVDEVHAIEGEI